MNSSELEILKFPVTFNSVCCGEKLNDVSCPAESSLIGLIRKNHWIPAHENPEICEQDFLVVVIYNAMFVPRVKVYFSQKISVDKLLSNSLNSDV